MFEEKILVEIIDSSNHIKKRKKFPVKNGFVIFHKGKGVRGDPTLKAKYDNESVLTQKYFFGLRITRKLQILEGATSCISFKRKKAKLGYQDVAGFFDAGVVKTFGSTIQHIKIPLAFYLIVGAVLILQIISLFLMSGRVRIV